MLDEFDFDAGLHFGPVALVQQLGFKAAHLLLGRADDAAGLALAQEVEIVFADHASIHDPDALGLAVFLFHHFDHVLNGGDVGSIARKDFGRNLAQIFFCGALNEDLISHRWSTGKICDDTGQRTIVHWLLAGLL